MMDAPTITYLIGFILVFVGEMWSAHDEKPKNTISERLWWFTGRGRNITWFFLLSRIFVFGFITWWLLHTAGVDV